MAALSTLQSAWLHLLSCALNGSQPNRALLSQISPQALYQLAGAHKMLALTAFALNRAGIHESHFEQAKQKAKRRLALFEMERKTIFRAFEQANLRFCPLKGILLADDYPALGMREMSDNDVLCDGARMEDVKTIMQSLGYRCESYGEGHHDIYTKEPCLQFEMHRTLFEPERMPEYAAYYADVFAKLQPVGGCEYRLSDEDFYIFMLAHEYKHFSHNGTGLRPLADVYVFLRAHGSMNWRYIASELSKLRLSDFESHNRTLANKVFSGAALSEDETEQLLVYLDSSLYGSVERRDYNKMSRALGGRDDKGEKARYLFRRVFLSGEELKTNYPFFYRHKVLLPVLYVYRPIKGAIRRPGHILREAKNTVKYKSPKHKF